MDYTTLRDVSGHFNTSELVKFFLFLFVNLGRSQMSLSKLGTEVNQIKWDWAYQSSGLLGGPCWLPEHMSSFIFSQFTWWINSPAECLAPILHLHKSDLRWNIQSSPLPRRTSVLMLWLEQSSPLSAQQRGLNGVGRLYLPTHTHIYSVTLIAYHQGLLKTIMARSKTHFWSYSDLHDFQFYKRSTTFYVIFVTML